MPGNFKNDDLRILKTQKALMDSLKMLLRRRNFNKITVNDICGQVQISRVAFYSHYQDKYDLLRRWLKTLKCDISICDGFKKTKTTLNALIAEHSKIIINIIDGASAEVSAIVCNFIFSLFDIPEERDSEGRLTEQYIVLYNFCSGGLLNLLNWHISNGFPKHLQPVNDCLCEILKVLLKSGKK